MKVFVAESPEEDGLCIGISRGIQITAKAADENGDAVSFEPAHELELRRTGAKVIAGLSSVESDDESLLERFPSLAKVKPVGSLKELASAVKEIASVVMVIGARGIPPSALKEAQEMGLNIFQGTCPFVLSQEKDASRLVQEGYDLIYCGDPKHHGVPRLEDIARTAGRRFFVAEHAEDVDGLPRMAKAGVMAQTTQSLENLQSVVARMLTKAHELKVVNSICGDSIPRQATARELAAQTDVFIVIGESSGARRIEEVCTKVNPRLHRVRTPDELRPEWFVGAASVGVAGGNATPDWIVQRFVDRIREIGDAATASI